MICCSSILNAALLRYSLFFQLPQGKKTCFLSPLLALVGCAPFICTLGVAPRQITTWPCEPRAQQHRYEPSSPRHGGFAAGGEARCFWARACEAVPIYWSPGHRNLQLAGGKKEHITSYYIILHDYRILYNEYCIINIIYMVATGDLERLPLKS